MRRPILTLTTDFGGDGPYVAAVKGVVLGRVPDAQIVDVSHVIAPQNILEGAFVMASIVEAFPEGTVHLGVIDPGVGTDRRLVAVSAGGQWFVAPDNGLLSLALQGRPVARIWEIANPSLRRPPVSATFHGRDILAPAAAHLLIGGDPAALGPRRDAILTLDAFEPRADRDGLVGEVIFRDAFGNLVTNVPAARLEGPSWSIEVAGRRIDGLCRTYADRPPGTLIALVGSTGWIEVAVVNGDAARTLDAGPGATVWFRRRATVEAAEKDPDEAR